MGILREIVLGAAAGTVAGVVQPLVGKVEEGLFFPEHEDTNIPKHFVHAAARRLGVETTEEEEMAAGTVFHAGYALFWGAVYAVAREEARVPPLAGAVGLGGLLYLLAFSRAGAGTRAGSEPHPDVRPARHWLLTTSMPMVFGLATAAVYEEIRRW